MTQVIKRLRDYIKLQAFTKRDLLLVSGFIFALPFLIFSWLFTVTKDPSEIIFKPYMMIICFSISMLSWVTLFFLEIKDKRVENRLFLWIFLFFQVFSLVVVLVQPSNLSFDVVVRRVADNNKEMYGEFLKEGDIIPVSISIPPVTRMFFSFATLLINWFVFINLFYLPRRLKGTATIIIIGLTCVAFIFVVTIWSYITEAQNYVPFVKSVISGDLTEIRKYSMKSFLVESVPYGACLMLGMIFTIFLHSLTKKWYWWIVVGYCYINLFFSYCRTSLIIATLTLIFYVVFRTILTIKQHKMRKIIFLSIFCGLLLTSIIFIVVSLATKGKFMPLVNQIFSPFLNTGTLRNRINIWKNINLELSGGWWIIGRGFGTHNYILYEMNKVNADFYSPSHSTFYAVLGAGGVPNVIGFYGLCAYFIYVLVKCWKVDKVIALSLSIGFIAYFIYSITEGVNYIICGVMIPLFYYYHSCKNSYSYPV